MWPNEPWLSYSPGGQVPYELNISIKLFEIECPYKCKSMNLLELVLNLIYNVCSPDGANKLKKNHMYYAQIRRV